LLVSIALVLCAWSPAFALPPLPHYVSGTVTVDGSSVSDGTVITAWADTTQLATTTTLTNPPGGGASYYAISLPGDDSETPGVIEGATPGSIVRFYVGAPYRIWAEQQVTWQSGTLTTIHLTATPGASETRLYCPVISRP